MLSNVMNNAPPYAPINVTASFPIIDTNREILTKNKAILIGPLFSVRINDQPC